MRSLSGLPEVPCARCERRIRGLGWGELCPDCLAERKGRARSLANRISLAATVLMAVAVATNLGLLLAFKYAGFLVDNLNGVLARLHVTPVVLGEVHLPLGISFFTFHALSYVIDVYRGKQKPLRRRTVRPIRIAWRSPTRTSMPAATARPPTSTAACRRRRSTATRGCVTRGRWRGRTTSIKPNARTPTCCKKSRPPTSSSNTGAYFHGWERRRHRSMH